MSDRFDCVVCGELCADLPIWPIDHNAPLAGKTLVPVEPIRPHGGGIVANSGIALARLSARTAAVACIGRDWFGDMLVTLLKDEGIDTSCLLRHDELPSSATAVLIGEQGEHTFAYHNGASRALTREAILEQSALFEQADFALFGYYGLMPELEGELAEVLRQVRASGCKTALDAAGGGGSLQPLDRILPHLDLYVPSQEEAIAQTGLSDPRQVIEVYRRHGCAGLLGVKLGARGALLSPSDGDFLEIEPIQPPGPVIDTTGAGDCFYAGLIAGLSRGLSVAEAGRIGAAAGACSVTGLGAVAGLRDFLTTRKLAGV